MLKHNLNRNFATDASLTIEQNGRQKGALDGKKRIYQIKIVRACKHLSCAFRSRKSVLHFNFNEGFASFIDFVFCYCGSMICCSRVGCIAQFAVFSIRQKIMRRDSMTKRQGLHGTSTSTSTSFSLQYTSTFNCSSPVNCFRSHSPDSSIRCCCHMLRALLERWGYRDPRIDVVFSTKSTEPYM